MDWENLLDLRAYSLNYWGGSTTWNDRGLIWFVFLQLSSYSSIFACIVSLWPFVHREVRWVIQYWDSACRATSFFRRLACYTTAHCLYSETERERERERERACLLMPDTPFRFVLHVLTHKLRYSDWLSFYLQHTRRFYTRRFWKIFTLEVSSRKKSHILISRVDIHS